MCFLVSLLFVASFCNADGKTVEVVGVGECADCAENNFETSQAFSGIVILSNLKCAGYTGHSLHMLVAYCLELDMCVFLMLELVIDSINVRERS